MKKMLAAATLVFGANGAQAATVTCQARVGLNRTYDATFDTATGATLVRNDLGTELRGNANVTVSGSTGDTLFFLATGFSTGVQIDLENGGQHRIALCLQENECYLCRRP